MEVTFRSNHGADIPGALDYLHFAKFFTVRCHPIQQLMATVAAILHRTALLVINVESSHPIHNNEGRRKGGHH